MSARPLQRLRGLGLWMATALAFGPDPVGGRSRPAVPGLVRQAHQEWIAPVGYAPWAIAGSRYEVVKGFLLLFAGTPVYLWIRHPCPRVDALAGEQGGQGTGRHAELPVAVDAAELELTKR
jgi:hypothetical protein